MTLRRFGWMPWAERPTMVNDSNINNMGVSKNRGTPKWMVFMENPI